MKTLLDRVNGICEQRLGRRPNLESPKGYNDKIQWLKLYDQMPEHVTACDKFAVRGWVSDRVGPEVLNECIYCADDVREGFPFPYVLKATHDSGSVFRVLNQSDLTKATQKIRDALSRPYGVHKGEWAYAMVPPRVMAEALMPGPVVDYKFHCTHGKVRWVQVISERETGEPKEAIFLPDGELSGLHMDHKMTHSPNPQKYPGDLAWSELTGVAEALADGWRYVRVDLYYAQGVRFGELTFWPLSGSYQTDDEPTFGRMLEIDLSYKRPALVS